MTKLIVQVVTFFLIITASALLLLPLEVHIITDIAQLYKIDFITSIPKEVMFGILLLIGMLKINIKDKDLFGKKDEEKDVLGAKDEYGIIAGLKSFVKIIVMVIILLLSWWVAYFIHGLNHF